MIPLLLGLLACGGGGGGAVDAVPVGLDHHECGVCGMGLDEQPAPRAQVLYRNGQRRFACSIADLRVLVQTPDPNGTPVAVWVEEAPDVAVGRDERRWLPAEGAWFVFGVERPEVMGVPALVFDDHDAAEARAAQLGGHAVPWSSVRETPFARVPSP